MIDSQTTWGKLSKLPVLTHWLNISVDFAKENISKTSSFIGLFYESALVMNGFICLRKKSLSGCAAALPCNFLPKRHIFFRDIGTDSSVESWLSFFLENMLSLMRCGNSQAWSFLRISAAVFIGDWDKAEHSASKHLLARCRMPELQRSPTWVCVHVCV